MIDFQLSDSKFGKQKINLSHCNNQITQKIYKFE